MVDWALTRKMLNLTKLSAAMNGNVPQYNTLEAQLGFTTDHPEITRLTPGTEEYIDAANEYAKMDYTYWGNYIEDAQYFKIREVSLSYSFRDMVPGIGYNYIKYLTIGFSALNVLTITNYSGADPVVDFDGSRSLIRGQDFLTLQHPRAYNLWVKISL